MFDLGMPELLLILFLLLLFFGKSKLPELARSLGSSFRELRKGFSDGVSTSDTHQDAPKQDAQKKADGPASPETK